MKKRIKRIFCGLLTTLFFAVTIRSFADNTENPIIWADVPDMSIVRVEDSYYMSSTTMHLSPGLPIMKSKNLVDWEIAGYAYDVLEDSDALSLRNGKNQYGSGSWASSLRHHDGLFYVSTFAGSTGKTHVYTTKEIVNEPWKEVAFRPALHDHSLFFEDDGRTYMVYGSGDIRLVELESDLSGIKRGGINRVIVPDAYSVGSPVRCLAEGSQMFKHEGRYYLCNIIWPPKGMRTQIVHRADRIEGPYEGRVILQDRGVAQGGLIDTPDGRWYAYLFQDCGAVGRVPFLVPMKWENGWPVLGEGGKIPMKLDRAGERSKLGNIVVSDEFDRPEIAYKKSDESGKNGGSIRDAFPPAWQWNHNPDHRFWSLGDRPGWLRLKTGRTDKNITEAQNSLTQRTFGPTCSASTFIDSGGMKDGDYAGIAAFQKKYGFVGVKMAGGKKSVVMAGVDDRGVFAEEENVLLEKPVVHLKIECDFRNRKDEASFYWSEDGTNWKSIGKPLRMVYTIPHFMGYRFALFHFATQNPGGFVDFDFYRLGERGESSASTSH